MSGEGTVNALVEQLEGDKSKLENSVVHLQRSINELKDAIASEGDEDREFKKAIEENIVVIARYKAKIERLDQEIGDLKQGIQNLDSQVAVPATEAAAGESKKSDEAMPDANNDNSGMYL